ncbi:MAG: hypothetical protein DRI26_07695 [Chloroflexi bacterium]|nr:MAG: hypothetical protein DRI26_07695 [Chloroflexota bacterium]
MRLYIAPFTPGEVKRYTRQGEAPCCNIEHGKNPPMIDFSKNSAALDSLIQRGWCVCGHCYRKYLRNGHCQIVIVDRRTKLPVA